MKPALPKSLSQKDPGKLNRRLRGMVALARRRPAAGEWLEVTGVAGAWESYVFSGTVRFTCRGEPRPGSWVEVWADYGEGFLNYAGINHAYCVLLGSGSGTFGQPGYVSPRVWPGPAGEYGIRLTSPFFSPRTFAVKVRWATVEGAGELSHAFAWGQVGEFAPALAWAVPVLPGFSGAEGSGGICGESSFVWAADVGGRGSPQAGILTTDVVELQLLDCNLMAWDWPPTEANWATGAAVMVHYAGGQWYYENGPMGRGQGDGGNVLYRARVVRAGVGVGAWSPVDGSSLGIANWEL